VTYDQNALRWTSADVLSDVRRKASLPSTSTDFTDAVLLREATDVLWSFAGWALAQAGEGRALQFLNRSTITGLLLYTAGSSRLGEVALPALAIADTISNVFWFDSTGQQQRRLSQMDTIDEYNYGADSGDPQAYALYEGRLKLFPLPTTGGTVRINYQRRHGELVPDVPTSALTITAFNTGTSTATYASAPSPLGLVSGDEVDLYAASSPHRLLYGGLTVVGTPTSTDMVLSGMGALGTTPTQGLPMVGARICRAGQTPYVSMPLELRASITEKVTANVLRVIGDLQGSAAAEMAAKEELSRVMQLLSPRAKRDKAKAVNPFSHLRAAVRGFRRW
jgi:hypothetical protein